MRPMALIPIAALLVGCDTTQATDTDVHVHDGDADGDGFSDDDCDDTDDKVYPGAPETVGDGVDSDCDGIDPTQAYVGDWELTALSGVVQGYDLFGSHTNVGTMAINDALDVTIDVTATNEIDGYDVDLTGKAAPSTEVGTFELDLTGMYEGGDQSRQATTDWDCVHSDATVSCTGTMKLDDFTAAVEIDFKRPE